MEKKLIPEFEDNKLHNVTKEYIENTTRASGVKEVRKYLKDYMSNNACSNEVKNFIKLYLSNIALLRKTDIVSDGSYRSCVILIKPYTFYITHSGGYGDINEKYTTEDVLNYFINNSTKIFLNVSWISKEEDDEYWSMIDMFDDYENCYE